MPNHIRVVLAIAIVATLIASCHRMQTPKLAAAPIALTEHYCWWTAFRTTESVDAVATRFRQAYTLLGLRVLSASHLGDTAWVNASAEVADPPHEPAGARMVAYRVADSTHFRTYVTVFDSSLQTIIPSCQQIAQKAAASATAPRSLDGEEKLPVWRRRP